MSQQKTDYQILCGIGICEHEKKSIEMIQHEKQKETKE